MMKTQRTINELYQHFDRTIVKQEQAKKVIAFGLAMHTMKGLYKACSNESTKKSNILLIGPTGVGKTAIANQISEYFKVFKLSAKDISNEGLVGPSVRDHLSNWSRECDHISELENAVVFIDEFDKVCCPAKLANGGDLNSSIQHDLLKFIEGHEYHLKCGQKVDTKDILFIICGNFEAIRKARKEAIKHPIGFTGSNEIARKPLHVELQENGLIAELAGRISLVAELEELEREDLIQILKNKEDSILDQYNTLFTYHEEDFDITDEEIEEIVDACLENRTGARGLQTELDKLLLERFNI